MKRFTGKVMRKAMLSDNTSPHQKRNETTVTVSAFGIRYSIVLSTISMVAIDTLSVAKVIFAASAELLVCLRTPLYVSKKPKKNAKRVAKVTLANLCQPKEEA